MKRSNLPIVYAGHIYGRFGSAYKKKTFGFGINHRRISAAAFKNKIAEFTVSENVILYVTTILKLRSDCLIKTNCNFSPSNFIILTDICDVCIIFNYTRTHSLKKKPKKYSGEITPKLTFIAY